MIVNTIEVYVICRVIGRKTETQLHKIQKYLHGNPNLTTAFKNTSNCPLRPNKTTTDRDASSIIRECENEFQ